MPKRSAYNPYDDNGAGKKAVVPVTGIAWTTRTPSSAQTWRAAAWSPSLTRWVVVGSGANFMTSPDGITWTNRTAPNGVAYLSVVWAPSINLFCAAGNNSLALATSPDGITWTPQTRSATAVLRSVAWSPALSLFCACSSVNDRVVTSPDGVTWTIRTTPSGNWESVKWAPSLGLFVIVDTGGITASSPNGTTWTTHTGPLFKNFKGLGWSGTKFSTISDDGSVMTSTDAITWTAGTAITAPYDASENIAYGSGLFASCSAVAVGKVVTSLNGSVYTASSAPASTWNGIAYSSTLNQFLLCGTNTLATGVPA